MLIIDSFNKNVYIDHELVGFIGTNEIFVKGNKLADITDDGIISIGGKEIGYVDDDNAIIIHGNEVGYIDGGNNFVFVKPLGL